MRIVATGICHSDLISMDRVWLLLLPAIQGHEGSCIVEQVGAAVTHVQMGGPVVLTFNRCGHCGSCLDGHSPYCSRFVVLNVNGARLDGSSPISGGVHGGFFYQSCHADQTNEAAEDSVSGRSIKPIIRMN